MWGWNNYLHKSTADSQTLNTQKSTIVSLFTSCLEMVLKGTVICTLKKTLLSMEQREDPTYTCIWWEITQQRKRLKRLQKGSFVASGKTHEMLCVRRIFLKALQVPKRIQTDPSRVWKFFQDSQTERKSKQLYVMLFKASVQQKLIKLFFPASPQVILFLYQGMLPYWDFNI